MSLEFEWHDEKSRQNLERHGVSFDEARSVFADPFAATIFDPMHSDDEDRFVTIGTSETGTLLVVVSTDRGDVVRIISARLATRQERKKYEEGQ